MTDWATLQPFEIISCHYQFDGDPDPALKYFMVAHNVVQLRMIRCFKPTSNPRYYDAEPIRLSGIVEYKQGEIPCFPEPRTIVDPECR